MSTGKTIELSKKLKHYRLSESEYQRICDLLHRAPVGVEWALFSALWSEHCSYKSSRIHLRKFQSQNRRVVESMGENAGVVDLGEGERIAFKMESHNHPSFIEPKQGAATGVGGILRDIFTMGARPIASADFLCFGDPQAERMSVLVDGVVRGIGGYGNCVGVPTITGQTEFHRSYNRNILVNAMSVGYFGPEDKVYLSKAQGVGNHIVYVGAKTGRDGVHGASMASESFDHDSDRKKPNVQIGDPFYEKLLIESCLEVMREGLVVAIQDMGAAGLTSSSFEMAAKGRVGFEIHLEKVPLRDETMTPEEILLSESQERMLLICEPKKFARLQESFHRWDLDAAVIGTVCSEEVVKLYWKGELLTQMDPKILVDQAPLYERPYARWQQRNRVATASSFGGPEVRNVKDELLNCLRGTYGTSREWIYRQYDQRVGARTRSDCSRPMGILRLPSQRELSIALGCRPYLMRFDARVGAIDAVALPALQMAAKGFEPLAVTDCLNFGNPEIPEIMSEFVASVEGIAEMCQKLGIPVVSGNVSFYNETLGKNITSTPATGLVGLRTKIANVPDDFIECEGDKIFLVRTRQLIFGGRFQEERQDRILGHGELNTGEVAQFVQKIRKIVGAFPFRCTRVVGKYGLLYSLTLMAKRVGFRLGSSELNQAGITLERLFEEQLYEVILVLPKESANSFLVNGDPELEVHFLGETGGDRLVVGQWIDEPITTFSAAYSRGWEESFANLA